MERTVTISGRKLAAERRRAGCTEDVFATQTGFAKERLREIEASETSVIFRRRIPAIARALNMSEEEAIERLAPGRGSKIKVDLPVVLYDRLEREAAKAGVSVPDLIRGLLGGKGKKRGGGK